MTNLIARLQAAACEAIANERPGLESDVVRLRGVVTGDCSIERKGKSRREPAA